MEENYGKKKKKITGIKLGTTIKLFDGSTGVVIHSDKSYTAIREYKYKDFDSDVVIPTSQARRMIIKVA